MYFEGGGEILYKIFVRKSIGKNPLEHENETGG
jgi:hypothetical protein